MSSELAPTTAVGSRRGAGLLRAARRAIIRLVWPDLPHRIDALEARLAPLERVVESRLARLERVVVESLHQAQDELPPMQAHIREAVKMLSLGVAAVYGTDVEGDIAEFGTMTGTSGVGLARAIVRADIQLGYAPDIAGLPRKNLHLFDSFQGLPGTDNPVDNVSPHVRTGAWAPGTCVGLSRDELFARVRSYLHPSRIKIFSGWFSDTLKTLPPRTKYALVHIDSDLYASARDVLDHLFGNHMIARGAEIFFDDWNCNGASPDLGERRAWRECVEKHRVEASDEGGYGVFGHKFIVHSYR